MNGFKIYLPIDGSKGSVSVYTVPNDFVCTDKKPNIMILSDEFWAALRDCPNPTIEIKITNKWDDADKMFEFLEEQSRIYNNTKDEL